MMTVSRETFQRVPIHSVIILLKTEIEEYAKRPGSLAGIEDLLLGSIQALEDHEDQSPEKRGLIETVLKTLEFIETRSADERQREVQVRERIDELISGMQLTASSLSAREARERDVASWMQKRR